MSADCYSLLLLTPTKIEKCAPLLFSQCTQRIKSADEANVASAEQTSPVVIVHQGLDVIGLERKSPGRAIPRRVFDEEEDVFIETKVTQLVANLSNFDWIVGLD